MSLLAGRRRGVLILAITALLLTQLVLAQIFLVRAAGKPPPSPPLSIAVVGDSFAAGSMNKVVWPTLLAQRSGRPVSNLALPGTGFVADGRGGQAYAYQVERAQVAHPRIILVSTGLADTGLADQNPLHMGALDVINAIQLGGQRALVIGPTWYETPVPDAVRRVSDTVQKVADERGVPFLNALDPPWLTKDQMLPDLSGPNDEGQSVIADRVGAWLHTEVAGEN